MLYLRFMEWTVLEVNCVIKGTTLQRNYRKMIIPWSFSYNSLAKFHGKIYWSHNMTMLYPNLCYNAGLQMRVRIGKLLSLFLIQNIWCGYWKKPSQWDGSFEPPKHMFNLMGKKIIAILRLKKCLTGPLIMRCVIKGLHCIFFSNHYGSSIMTKVLFLNYWMESL